MSGFDLQKLNSQQTAKAADIKTGFNNNTTANSQTVGEIGLNKSDPYKALIEQYGINEEQLAKLLEICKKKGINVFDLSAKDEVFELVNTIKSETPETSEIQDTKAEITPEQQKETAAGVSHAEFVKLSKEQKVEVLVQELAKNKFLYGDKDNKKTEQDWNALSEEDRNKFIEEYKPQLKEKITKVYNLISEDKTDDFSKIDHDISKFINDEKLDMAHTTLLAIDNQGQSIENILNDKNKTKDKIKSEISKLVFEYLDDLSSDNPDGLTVEQSKYLKESECATTALVHHAKKNTPDSEYAGFEEGGLKIGKSEINKYAKEHGVSTEKMQIEYLYDKAGLSQESKGVIDILTNNSSVKDLLKIALEDKKVSENLSKYCKENNKDIKNLTGFEIKKILISTKYGDESVKNAENAIKSSKLTNDEKEQFQKLMDATSAFADVPELEESSILQDIESDKNYKKFSKDFQSNEILSENYYNVFKEKYSQLPPEEFANTVANLLGGLKARGQNNNSDIAFKLYQSIIDNATPEQQKALYDKFGTSRYNTSNADKVTSELRQDLAKKIAEEGNFLNVTSLTSSVKDDQVFDLNILKTTKNPALANTYTDRVIEIKDKDIQHQCLGGYEFGTEEAKAYQAENAYKFHEDNQLFALNTAINGSQMATDAANNSGVVAKMAAKNQTEAMNSIKNSIEDLWKGDDAISRLNNLSDQIKDCDPANQLDMHKSFMSSEYSEVVEHAAGNIKNYDPSVQGQAMDAVYQTGNKKAIEAGYSGLVEKYSNAQQLPEAVKNILSQETTRAIFESAPQEAIKEFLDKFKSGSLSYSDIQKLPASQKREYYMQLFKQARPEEKLQLIKKVPNGTMKKSMLKMIAVISPTFFDYMITSDADFAKNIYEMNLNESINNKIKHIANQKGPSRNDFAKIKEDIEEKSYPQTARTLTSSGMTIPEGFNPKEIFPKDKNGYLLG